jgi:hypothetical protein
VRRRAAAVAPGRAQSADGAYLSVSGLINEGLGTQGRRFAAAFGETLPGVDIEPSAIYTAEATGVLLDAVARSDGTRAAVLDELFRTSLPQRPDRQHPLRRAGRHHRAADHHPAHPARRARPADLPRSALDRLMRSPAD